MARITRNTIPVELLKWQQLLLLRAILNSVWLERTVSFIYTSPLSHCLYYVLHTLHVFPKTRASSLILYSVFQNIIKWRSFLYVMWVDEREKHEYRIQLAVTFAVCAPFGRQRPFGVCGTCRQRQNWYSRESYAPRRGLRTVTKSGVLFWNGHFWGRLPYVISEGIDWVCCPQIT